MILGLVTFAALAAVDPCAPVERSAAPDPAAAAEYRAVAAEERAAGDLDAAAVAWRKAAALDPADGSARAALADLCRAGPPRAAPHDPLPEAIRLLDAGRYREAAELLHAARRGVPAPDAALIEGICRYELGQDAEAAALLRTAETDPPHRDTARLYLGLIALREGSAAQAAAIFDAAAASPSVGYMANDLARTARWNGPVVLSLLAEAGYDSNVSLVPDARGAGDWVGGLSALAIFRPYGPNGLFLRAGGAVQQYPKVTRYDFNAIEGAAGWRWWRGGDGFTVEGAVADRTLDGSQYLATARVLATGGLALGRVALAGLWSGRGESYASPNASYSGFAQRADGRATVALGPRLRLGAGWSWGRDDANDSVLSWTEQGPRAELRAVLGTRARLFVDAGGAVRQYDRFDSAALVNARRRDVILDATAALEFDLTSRTTLRLSLLFRQSNSNVNAFDYTKVAPTAGIGVMMNP